MIRLYFYVEGQTEQEYAARVLRPHLAGFGVQVMGAVRAAIFDAKFAGTSGRSDSIAANLAGASLSRPELRISFWRPERW